MKKSRTGSHARKKARAPLYLLFIAFLLVVSALIVLRFSGASPAGSESVKDLVDSTELMQYAKGVKQDLKDVFAHLRDEDVGELEACVQRFDGDVASLKEYLSLPLWSLVEKVPGIGHELKTAGELIDVSETLSADLLWPWVSLRKGFGSGDEGVGRAEKLQAEYLFFVEKLPSIKALLDRVDGLDLSLVDSEGKISRYVGAARPLLGVAEKYSADLLEPLAALMEAHPLPELKTEKGYDFEQLGAYSDFLSEKLPYAQSMVAELRGLDLSSVDAEGKLSGALELAAQVLEIAGPANEELLRPGFRLLAEHPLSSIKVENGFNVAVILTYLDFAEEKLPAIDSLLGSLEALDLSRIDPEGKAAGKLEKLSRMHQQLRTFEQYIPAARVILADGSDRLYLLAAQNSAEIRASGGFPGAVGTIRIHDGVFAIESFTSVYNLFVQTISPRIYITEQEERMFTARMYTTWDVDFCPDFERVAQIWAYAFEEKTGVMPDGIISATPIIIQKLLAVSNEPITLSNGMVLDGATATRVVQRDLYFEYKRAGMVVYSDPDMTDVLFAEAMHQTISNVTSNLGAGTALDFVQALKDCIDERIVMIWMNDPAEEDLMREVGWSGGMALDPNDPKLGLFFSSEQSGKMGYFFDMVPTIGEPVVNEDGSRSYDVTLTLSNVITQEEQRIGGTWILGRVYTGSVMGDLTITAPAGGTITDIYTGIARSMRQETWQGLDTHYIQWLIIERGAPLVMHFKVTTAPGVDAPLGILATPTVTDYRS